MYNIFFSVIVNNGCIAQSVERWSNKPLVMGSSPIVTSFFCLRLHVRIRGRAVKALRSGRSQLCWRGFESHRMHDFFVTLFGVNGRMESFAIPRTRQKHGGKAAKEQKVDSKQAQKKDGGTGIRARVKRITTAYANHYTIPPRYGPR